MSCVWYHKDRNFQANHNTSYYQYWEKDVVFDTTKIEIFKQITTPCVPHVVSIGCVWYHKDRNFQANHNKSYHVSAFRPVVFDTTKIEIFKQITTHPFYGGASDKLCLIPQR